MCLPNWNMIFLFLKGFKHLTPGNCALIKAVTLLWIKTKLCRLKIHMNTNNFQSSHSLAGLKHISFAHVLAPEEFSMLWAPLSNTASSHSSIALIFSSSILFLYHSLVLFWMEPLNLFYLQNLMYSLSQWYASAWEISNLVPSILAKWKQKIGMQ